MGGFFGGGGASVDLASPSAIGSTTPNTGKFTTLEATTSLQVSTSGFLFGGTNLFEQRNSTNAQTFRIYNTYTDASNYERGFFRWNTNVLEIGAEAAGTGTKRTTRITAQDKTGGYNPIIELGFYPDNILFRRLSFTNNGGSAVQWGIDGSFIGNFSLDGLMVGSAQIGWNSGVAQNSADLVLTRDAADTLAQRRSTNAQTFRLYNTFTSSTNFERLNLRWASNEFILDAEKGSVGGTLRGVKIGSATTSLLGFYGVTPVDQPATVADPAGGLTVDAEARTAINAIIDRLQELGLIA